MSRQELPSQDDLRARIMEMTLERGGSKTVCPSEVARAIAGSNEKDWRLLMAPIRSAAVALANEGRVLIRRKGRIVDPDDFRGIYRIGLPETDDQGDGSSRDVRPESR